MNYKVLIKNRSTNTYSYYTQKIGTEEQHYVTEYLAELGKTYKALLANYTTDQIKLVCELEPEIVINLKDENNNSGKTEDENPVDDEL